MLRTVASVDFFFSTMIWSFILINYFLAEKSLFFSTQFYLTGSETVHHQDYKAQPLTKSSCPGRIRRFSPLTASQTFSVRSSLADGFGGEVLRAQVINLVDDQCLGIGELLCWFISPIHRN
jgi:hypothetical protein